jgi:apolipoprotein N-acyltransferase
MQDVGDSQILSSITSSSSSIQKISAARDPGTDSTVDLGARALAHASRGDSSVVTVRDIISQVRNQPAPCYGALICGLLTGLLLWASFYPLNWSFCAWIGLVPLLSLVIVPRATSKMYVATYVAGLVHYGASLQWMRYGDPMMYVAWWALAFYLACYFPIFLRITRLAVYRMQIPLVIAAPVVWTALEFVRAYLFTGFAWYYLGHSQYRWVDLIQISDLTGSYGVSFVIVAVNSALALHLPLAWYQKLRLFDQSSEDRRMHKLQKARPNFALKQSVIAGLILLCCVSYGWIRRYGVTMEAGPKVALIQGNMLASLRVYPEDQRETFHVHKTLTDQAVLHQPDLIVWPEGMLRWPLFTADPALNIDDIAKMSSQIDIRYWSDHSVQRTLQELSESTNAKLIIGILSFDASKQGISHYNSAVYVEGMQGVTQRYDKQHLVPFGEYIPLLDYLPLLKSFTPIATEFLMKSGPQPKAFAQGNWQYVPMICYEDTVPQLVSNAIYRAQTTPVKDTTLDRIVENKVPTEPVEQSALKPRSQILVNVSNDGWFAGSSEHDQHLITSLFRCVECRVPMVRAVNMGISAIIDGDGVIREPNVFIDGEAINQDTESKVVAKTSMIDPQTGRFYRKMPLALVGNVPLDHRFSLYVYCGDWFGYLCTILSLYFFGRGYWINSQQKTKSA